ncbi:uncharacterized protein MAM_07562 [Metarhizium album ARSEF 1941]|uniref:Uncharacterized protein n=1 Tax=Metarhizium album (strain ARSEF 1941) TaxID=1081103 RepID=A0A0B2WLZ2_METAS|nr:uncharacterized protein MAM_07562 [Metarhizium album ARSEF 1941]KHN94507.1 hypothetical protein MAM_07562 [Metarhizium album ARSEF 1941]
MKGSRAREAFASTKQKRMVAQIKDRLLPQCKAAGFGSLFSRSASAVICKAHTIGNAHLVFTGHGTGFSETWDLLLRSWQAARWEKGTKGNGTLSRNLLHRGFDPETGFELTNRDEPCRSRCQTRSDSRRDSEKWTDEACHGRDAGTY